MTELFETALAVWRVSNLLVNEDGPGRMFRRLRELSGIKYAWAEPQIVDMLQGLYSTGGEYVDSYSDWTPLTCMFCTSIWVSVAMLLVPRPLRKALAAAAIVFWFEKARDVEWATEWRRLATGA